MPSSMTFEQASTVLNAVVQQATGQSSLAAITSPQDFVSAAQTALKTGYDPVINAISQIWSRTIFAFRDYRAPLTDLEMDLDRYGNAVRKLSPVAASMIDDYRFEFPVSYDSSETDPYGTGESVDHYKINKQKVLQTNFYGQSVYQQRYTIFKDQFDAAFRSAEEFARFNAMNMTERNNDRESYKEAIARGLQANFIGALIAEGSTDRVIHLLTEYNTLTGQSLTAADVYLPANFAPFMRWVYARIKTLVRMFGERSQKFQTVINSNPILRHTRPDNMRIALYSAVYDQIETMVMSDTFHDDYLKGITFEGVNFWQSIATPDSISVTPVYTDTTGAVVSGSATAQANIFGFIHDRDALGFSFVNTWSAVTPLNIDGGYWNEAYHANVKTIQDNTEKAAVLLLD